MKNLIHLDRDDNYLQFDLRKDELETAGNTQDLPNIGTLWFHHYTYIIERQEMTF